MAGLQTNHKPMAANGIPNIQKYEKSEFVAGLPILRAVTIQNIANAKNTSPNNPTGILLRARAALLGMPAQRIFSPGPNSR